MDWPIDPRSIDLFESENTPWLGMSTPSDSDVQRLHRLLHRIPPHLSEVVRRYHLLGERQGHIGEALGGLTQMGVSNRLAVAMNRLRLVAHHLPDLLPDEVGELLQRAGERATVVDAATFLWREHRLGMHKQSTRWTALFRAPHGFGVRRGLEEGEVGDVARGLALIRSWPSTWVK